MFQVFSIENIIIIYIYIYTYVYIYIYGGMRQRIMTLKILKAIRRETRFRIVWLFQFEPCTKSCYALLIHRPASKAHARSISSLQAVANNSTSNAPPHITALRVAPKLCDAIWWPASKWDRYEIRQYMYATRINSWCNSTSAYTMPVLFPVHAKQPSYFFIEWPVVFSHLIHLYQENHPLGWYTPIALDTEILIPRSKPLSWYVRRSWPTRKGNK